MQIINIYPKKKNRRASEASVCVCVCVCVCARIYNLEFN